MYLTSNRCPKPYRGRVCFKLAISAVSLVVVIVQHDLLAHCDPAAEGLLASDEKVADISLRVGGGGKIKGLFYCDLEGNGGEDAVVFVDSKKPHTRYKEFPEWAQVRAYRKRGGTFELFWKSDAGYQKFFSPSGVSDLMGDGKLEVVDRGLSSFSIGSGVYIYALKNGQFERILCLDYGAIECDISDLDGNGRREIIARDKGGYTHVYSWDGSRFVEANRKYAGYFRHLVTRDLKFIPPPFYLSQPGQLYNWRTLLSNMASANMDMEVVTLAPPLLEKIPDLKLEDSHAFSITRDIKRILDDSRKRIGLSVGPTEESDATISDQRIGETEGQDFPARK
jgi:hypothetical protein